jgi:N-acetylmuramoyl-L-alanine amidase
MKGGGNYLLNTSFTAQGQDERIRFVILHYTALNQAESLAMLTGPLVSTHYLVPERPQWRSGMPVIMQLVPESKRAWHAGVSSWAGWSALNASSVGWKWLTGATPNYLLAGASGIRIRLSRSRPCLFCSRM